MGDDPADSLRVLTAEGIELLFSGLKGITVGEVSTRWSWYSDDPTDDDDLDPVWVCEVCGWEGDPDKVGDTCPKCGREIGDDEP